jgi:hypothetical protein
VGNPYSRLKRYGEDYHSGRVDFAPIAGANRLPTKAAVFAKLKRLELCRSCSLQ